MLRASWVIGPVINAPLRDVNGDLIRDEFGTIVRDPTSWRPKVAEVVDAVRSARLGVTKSLTHATPVVHTDAAGRPLWCVSLAVGEGIEAVRADPDLEDLIGFHYELDRHLWVLDGLPPPEAHPHIDRTKPLRVGIVAACRDLAGNATLDFDPRNQMARPGL